MILSVPGLSIKSYLENPIQVLVERRVCPSCGRPLARHDRYRRHPMSDGEWVETWIHRLRCRPCSLTFSLLPAFLRPRARYVVEVVAEAADIYLTSQASHRTIAVVMSGMAVPSDGDDSLTDALLHRLHPRPSYQRIFAWIKEFAEVAESLGKQLLAWSLRLQPDHDVLDQLAADAEWIRGKGRSDEKRDQLVAAAQLRKLVLAVPALGAAHLGWFQALGRFVERILGVASSRAPPATHGETLQASR